MKPPQQWIEEYGNGGPDNDGYLCHDASLPRYGENVGLEDMYRLVQEDAFRCGAEAMRKAAQDACFDGSIKVTPETNQWDRARAACREYVRCLPVPEMPREPT